ncbi:conserved hypothetical protein [Ricinus communis]|uniref:Uncharacterized protein n=1 Tax=Ricinus communis TaxID=3988 RepID=B9RTQ9_RICCO|nr:conserved hypothetical protein [Ricinus communis]
MQEDDRVVCICFSSDFVLSNDQMEEMAFGLGKCEVHFMWCDAAYKGPRLRRVSKIASGFETGRIHAGLVAGMPMLTWSLGADQFPNASFIS